MIVYSLFDGGSCGYQALKDAGIKVDKYYASEIDDKAIKISEHNHKDIIRLGDVKNWNDWDVENVDLVIGGSPCQGFSRQGKGLNFDDPRSKLFFEFADFLEKVKIKNPNVKFLLENVNMKKEWENVITEYMGVEPVHFNSDLLLPHNRPRTYWTNINFELPKHNGNKLLDILESVNLHDFVEKKGIKIDKSFSEESIDLVNVVNGEVRISQAVKNGYIEANPGDGINISFPTSKTRRGRVVKGRSSCLDTSCDIGLYDDKGQIRRFTVTELERLQGLPDGYTSCVDESAAKKFLGNGWTVDVIAHIFKGLKQPN